MPRKFVLHYDKLFVFAVLALIVVGLIMVASASMAISERQFEQPFYYLCRQGIYLVLGFFLLLIVVRIKMDSWLKLSFPLLLLALMLLALVLVPGIGRSVNGSRRWIGFGFIGMQVSEIAKLAIVIFMANYLAKNHKNLHRFSIGFLIPIFLLGLVALLLLMEPDFGALVVIGVTVLSMMYLAGVKLWQFAILLLLVIVAFAFLAISSPYRLLRLTTFLNPWANPFDSGYQLTQSLIAFGRGGFLGVGLGSSIQKLFYLPEAHTDFLFAVLAEEIGLIGVLAVIGLYVVMVWRALFIGRRAQLAGRDSCGYMAYGFAAWLGMQAFVNMGVNAGLLPTKGLTLPLMSYGGSSMLIVFVVIAILLRIDYETRYAGETVRRGKESLYHLIK
jgi:cell division protein FtsW